MKYYFVLYFASFFYIFIVLSPQKQGPGIDMILSCEGKIFLSIRDTLMVEM